MQVHGKKAVMLDRTPEHDYRSQLNVRDDDSDRQDAGSERPAASQTSCVDHGSEPIPRVRLKSLTYEEDRQVRVPAP